MDAYSYDETIAPASSGSPLRFDFRTLLVTVALVAIGLISIYSATHDPNAGPDAGPPTTFLSQLVFAIGGVVAMISLAFLPERWIRVSSFPLYAFGYALLLAVIAFGTVRYGQKNWIILGPISLQPSELAKFGTLMMAGVFVNREGRDLSNWRDIAIVMAIVLGPVPLIMLEPDFGSATVYFVMLLGIALWAGADLFLLFSIVAPAAVAIAALFGSLQMYIALGVVLLCMLLFRRSVMVTLLGFGLSVVMGFSTGYVYQHVMQPHQRARIDTFLNPNLDPRGAGYHVIQSLMAVGSGGFTGKGFLHGTQTQLRYIPEQWTDFIYCVPTEEFGFVGGMTVLILLGALIWLAVDTASHLRSKFESTICFGIAVIFLYHAAINIGMAIGLVPVMGIPLPFLSKGGSSLLLNMSMVGLLLNFYRFRTDLRRP
ncbi:MAG: rod shape-determining protein RodA [Bacteroidetes bacterium]|nr:rod shape-determining protein RodA [Bacteroidota bacterium]